MSIDYSARKDPGETLDYGFTWTLESGETIDTSSWSVTSGVTTASPGIDSNVTSIWVSGGTTGTSYDAENTIETSEGRTFVRTLRIYVEER